MLWEDYLAGNCSIGYNSTSVLTLGMTHIYFIAINICALCKTRALVTNPYYAQLTNRHSLF